MVNSEADTFLKSHTLDSPVMGGNGNGLRHAPAQFLYTWLYE